jgi:hypothetical protein
MRPFDLKKALSGEPVVTRNGTTTSALHFFPSANSQTQRVIAVIGGIIRQFYDDGRWAIARNDSDYDLFMAPVKRQEWVNIYKKHGRLSCSEQPYGSYEDAIDGKSSGFCGEYVNSVLIREWEE